MDIIRMVIFNWSKKYKSDRFMESFLVDMDIPHSRIYNKVKVSIIMQTLT